MVILDNNMIVFNHYLMYFYQKCFKTLFYIILILISILRNNQLKSYIDFNLQCDQIYEFFNTFLREYRIKYMIERIREA